MSFSMRARRSRGLGGPGSVLLRAAGWLVTGLAVALGGLMLLPTLLGLERYVITGGSMSGSIERGSIVLEEVVPTDELEVGDVITYVPPKRSAIDGLITHRIISIERPRGELVLRTKGDANRKPDPWRFQLDGDEQARVVADVPYLGYVLAALSLREVRMAAIGLPALLIALLLVRRLWRDSGSAVEPGAAEALEQTRTPA